MWYYISETACLTQIGMTWCWAIWKCCVLKSFGPLVNRFFVCTWYRSPNSDMSLFNEFDVILQKCEFKDKELIVVGDINCDVMKSPPDAHTQQFNFLPSLYQLD